MSPGRLLLAAAIALAVVFLVRWWLPSERPALLPTVPPDPRFDYSLSDFEGRFHDADGRLELVIGGPRLEHDSATRIATVTDPRFVIDPSGQPWHGRADQAQLARDDEEMALLGNVRLSQAGARGELVITTEALYHQRASATLTSDQPVEARQPGTWLRGQGLSVWLNDQTIELSEHVQGQMATAGPHP